MNKKLLYTSLTLFAVIICSFAGLLLSGYHVSRADVVKTPATATSSQNTSSTSNTSEPVNVINNLTSTTVNTTSLDDDIATYVVAAYNSSADVKAKADVVCTGVNDQETILKALTKAAGFTNGVTFRWGHLKLMPGRYNFGARLDLPPLEDFIIDARGTTLGQANNGSSTSGIRIDSMIRSHVYFGQVTGSTDNVSVLLNPRNNAENGSTVIGVTESEIYINEISGYPIATGKIGFEIQVNDNSFGISWSKFTVQTVNYIDTCIYITKPTGTGQVRHNVFDIGQLTGAVTAVIDGDAEPNTNKITGNKWTIAVLDAKEFGIKCYGNNETIYLYQAVTPANSAIYFGSYSQNNVALITTQVAQKGYSDVSAPPGQSTCKIIII